MMLVSPSRPRFVLVYKGIDISSEIWPHLISCTYTDHVHGQADEIEVAVQDKDGLWRGGWCPEHGDVVTLALGYEGGIMVPAGEFEIDEPEAHIGRDGDTLSFRGVSAPITKAMRTKKTRAFEHQSLKQIAQKVAGEHGLALIGTPPDMMFERVTQRRERDLEFLSRMADQYGAYFAVKGGKRCVFVKREEVHRRAPVRVVETSSAGFKSASLKRQSHKTYSKSKVSHFEGQQKKNIEASHQDSKVRNGDTLRIDDRVENEGQAKARAKAELERENLKRQTATLDFEGDPLLLAGNMVELGGSFGSWAGRYVINTARHHISRDGYDTSIELNGV